MNKQTVQEAIACMPRGRTKFYYYKERYSQELLAKVSKSPMPINAWRKSQFGRLLDRPIIKNIMKQYGGKPLSGTDFLNHWSNDFQEYLLTLGTWGSNANDSWYQTTRKGYNLVLQMNFTQQHNASYQQCYKTDRPRDLNSWGHPTNEGWRYTTAWSRIDFDLSTGEALIEEIQSDWVRAAQHIYRVCQQIQAGTASRGALYHYSNIDTENYELYWQQEILPIQDTWHESMLTATIKFIVEELGIKDIYYHTWQTGAKLKRIDTYLPPRSLYTDLPRKFCFEKSNNTPRFLLNEKRVMKCLRKQPGQHWQRLRLK